MIAKSTAIVAAALVLGFSDARPLEFKHLTTLRANLGGAASPLPVAPQPIARAALSFAPTAAESRAALVTTAVRLLSDDIAQQSHPDALRLAFQAYFSFKALHREQVRNPYLYFVDYGLDSQTPRGYVFDMETLTLVDGPFTVAHGRGSVADGSSVPTRFSNRLGSAATSLGLYLTQETYAFRGTSDGHPYRSVGLRLRGLSGRFNSGARGRGVVVHGAPYVTAEKAGRSEGCPAMEPGRAEKLIPQISNGGLVFLFSPLDSEWLREQRWAAGDSHRAAAGSAFGL